MHLGKLFDAELYVPLVPLALLAFREAQCSLYVGCGNLDVEKILLTWRDSLVGKSAGHLSLMTPESHP